MTEISKEQDLELLRQQAEKLLNAKVANVRILSNNMIMAEQVDGKGHTQFVKLADGTIVPLPSSKELKAIKREVKSAVKKNRPIRLNKC